MINDINLDYLKIFYEVVKQKNVSKAATSLHISQPAITQTMNKLEEGLGAKLLNRTNKGVTLTKIGEKIFERVSSALINIKSIDTIILEENELYSGNIIIGCGTNIAKKVLVQPIKKFHILHPKIKFSIIDDAATRQIERLENGEVELCIIQKGNNIKSNLLFHKLIDESYVFVYNPKMNIKNDSELCNNTFIVQNKENRSRNLFENFCKMNNWNNVNVFEVVGYNMAIELCLNEVGITLVPSYLVEDYIKNGKLKQLDINIENPTLEYGYCINPEITSKAALEFIKFLK